MKLYPKIEILQLIKKFAQENANPIIEILGPTASGKTGFSVEVAKKISPSEILSVDSRQIYQEMDISSAKVTAQEMQGIPHWGLDLIRPDATFSAYDFQKYAFDCIDRIRSRGALPILCGGTMLWLDAISENYIFHETPNKKSVQRGKPRFPVLKIGLHWDRKTLYERIDTRAEWQFEHGLIEETEKILKKYTLSRSALTSFGYREIKDFLDGRIDREEALRRNQKRNRNYAKRQLTWWRGREDVIWVDGAEL